MSFYLEIDPTELSEKAHQSLTSQLRAAKHARVDEIDNKFKSLVRY